MKSQGKFGNYGGLYVPESLMPALEELESAFNLYSNNAEFMHEFRHLLATWAGRPTPLYEAKNLSVKWGARIFLKREDLLHGGAHKTNNALGQALLAKAMGKKRLIAETGAGQHGVASAMAAALFGVPCEVYMGELDIERQMPNVRRMQLLGAKVHAVKVGGRTLKEAINEALRDWISNLHDTYYLLGTAAGPHPYPTLVKFFQSIIGEEAREQSLKAIDILPDYVLACVGGGSNAIGVFAGFLNDKGVELVGVEPGGKGIDTDEHGAVLCKGTPGVLHGMKSMLLQNDDGQVHETYSVAAGLDYPSVGPEHAYLKELGRAQYVSATDKEALDAFRELAASEGIIPALESSHAVAYAKKLAAAEGRGKTILVNLSGRGDKDLEHIERLMNYGS
jgi:tryptophan synthase beta chain